MGSTARFLALLVAGIAIVVLYVRTGESLGVLLLSLSTLLIGLGLIALRPWQVDPNHVEEDDWDDTWRCGHDVVWDGRGIEAVAVGDRLPRLVVWSRVDGIHVGRHRAAIDDRPPDQRRGLRLALYRPMGQAGPGEVWLSLGPDQEPDQVAAELDRAWRQRRHPNMSRGR